MKSDVLFEFDRVIRNTSGELLCGIDEAGRGPLAGPVVCAAVILQPNAVIDGLDDSKRLSEKKRLSLYKTILKVSIGIAVAMIHHEEIDRVNILNATMKGMRDAYSSLNVSPDFAIIDGNRLPEGLNNSRAIVKGDALSASIAAASIVAKTERDQYMRSMDALYPEYQFSKHKGYPTKLHYEMIDKYGVTPIHRKSFLKGRV